MRSSFIFSPALLIALSTNAFGSPQSQCEILGAQASFPAVDTISAQWYESTSNEPAYCIITGSTAERVSTVDGAAYAIGFEMRLPANWNQRFLMQANGGNDGRVVPATGSFGINAEPALIQGFAVMSSDAGHKPVAGSLLGGSQFGFDPQARLDYGYNAHVSLTPIAKSLVNFIYDEALAYSYFMGCSNGGRQTMVAASRLSNEYDGFVAGNPGFNLPKAAIQHAWDIQTLSALNSDVSKALSRQDMQLASSSVLEQCDALDGLSDGIVGNLAQCQALRPLNNLACSDDQQGACLTDAKLGALQKMFAGPHNSAGEQLYSDWPVDAGISSNNWRTWKMEGPGGLPLIVLLGAGSLANIFMTPPEIVEPSPAGLLSFLRNYSFDTDAQRIFAKNEVFNASAIAFMTPPDVTALQSLKDSGGKLMVYHGASDGVFSVNDTIAWMQSLNESHNPDAQDFARLYTVPGMGHCSGGPATDKFEMLDAMVQWVENGIAPDSVLAQVSADNPELPDNWSKQRTRLLCPHPQVAWYEQGDVEAASSFSCR